MTTVPPRLSWRPSERTFLGAVTMLFTISAVVTIAWCRSMSSMDGMPMPGGWTMSMVWMRAPGQTWSGAAGAFLGMWMVMMAAMMLPSLIPMLRRYRAAVTPAAHRHLGVLTTVVGSAYFLVWLALGAAIFVLGAAATTLQMQYTAVSRAAPVGAGVVVLLAGLSQFSKRKAHHLACCREHPPRGARMPVDARAAWSHGLRLGLHCVHASAGLTAVLLVAGVMDLRAMGAVTAAITAERLAPAGERVAHAVGAAVVGMALLILAGISPAG